MNIDKKVAHYLRNTWIDFQTFYILDIILKTKMTLLLFFARYIQLKTKCSLSGIRVNNILISHLII